MIDPKEIESKDFSDAIPDMMRKLSAISGALMAHGLSEDAAMEQDNCTGFALFLEEIEADLFTIFKALYRDDDSSSIPIGGEL